MYAYWVCAARETPIFSPEFPFRSISFSQNYQKNPEHHHFTFFDGFCRSGDHHFQNFFNFNPFIASHGRFNPKSVRQRCGVLAVPEIRIFTPQNGSSSFRCPRISPRSNRFKLVPEPRIFKLKTAQARSGAPHFHARPGARSGALAHFHFAAAHTGVSTPPPPRGGGGGTVRTQMLNYGHTFSNYKTVNCNNLAMVAFRG